MRWLEPGVRDLIQHGGTGGEAVGDLTQLRGAGTVGDLAQLRGTVRDLTQLRGETVGDLAQLRGALSPIHRHFKHPIFPREIG
jgi:hypothetical protein